MFFDEVYNPVNRERSLTESEMKQARLDRWGADNPNVLFDTDMSDRFNTELTEEEEKRFQEWAKEHNRLNDAFNYDIRGAWKELQSGTMAEDERGHLGDRYKKPNHPTFSNQSVYSSDDNIGGTWSVVDGKDVYTPGRKLSKKEADSLKAYFDKVEPNAVLDLNGKVLPEARPLPGITRELGWFDGFGDTWKGLNSALYETGSSVLTALSNTPIGTEQERQGWRNYAKQLRANSKKNWDADPETMGSASQIIYGFVKTMPKAIGYGMTFGPAGGSLAFGADVGIQETQKLKDEGVDEQTAINAGVLSFSANAIGLRLPAALGKTRIGSAVYGAVVNVGTEGFERKGIQYILENQDYGEIAKQYDLTWTDLAVSAGLGAVFGAVTWRSPAQIRHEQMQKRLPEVKELYKQKLMKRGFTEEEATAQADLNARSAVFHLAMANKLDATDEQIAKILIDDTTVRPDGSLDMPNTQGKQWIYGDRAARNPDKKVRVTEAGSIKSEGRISDVVKAELDKYKIDSAKRLGENDAGKFLKNDDTGWSLTINGGDKAEIVSAVTKRGDRSANLAAVMNLRELVKNAFLAESYRDIKAAQGVKGEDRNLKGIHRLYAPMRLNGEDYLVKLTVKDKSGNPGDRGLAKDDRVSVYQLVSIEANKSKSAQGITPERNEVGTLTADGTSRPQPEGLSRTSQQRRPHGEPSSEISVQEMLIGVNRDGDIRYVDGKKDEANTSRFFVNEPNQWALEDGGSYYNTPEELDAWENAGSQQLYQRTIKIKPSSEGFDPNWRPLRRTEESMTQEERTVFDEYVNSRSDADRIRSNFERLKGTPWAQQAIEAVFVRASILDLIAGREPRVQSMIDHPQMAGLKRLLQQYGEEGLWQRLADNGFVGDAAKPAHNVNGSFLDCSPSLDCAKFCYATEGHYRYAASVVKAELIAEAVRRDPARAAEMTAMEYRGTHEYAYGKALRLYDKGDGNLTWLPYINELNKRGIRVQIFSKRADFLKQVSDFNLRLLSIDASNLKMADEHPDLNVAFVYSDTSQIPTILKIHHEGRLSVILPVKEGRKYMSSEKVNELRSADKTLAKHICPIDAGWKKIKSKKQPDGWNCTMCDKNAGVGCFHGASTENVMRAASQSEAELIDVEGMDLVALAKLLQKELGDDLERVAKSGERVGGAESKLGSMEGSRGGSGTINVSSSLANKLQALLSGVIRSGERNSGQGTGRQTGGIRQGPEQVRAEMAEASGKQGGVLYQRGAAGAQRTDGQSATGESGSVVGKLKQIDKNLEQRMGDVKGWYDVNENAIHLTSNADISTFSHEHAHWYMVKLLQFAGEEEMNPEVVEDALKLLNAMGIKSLDDWNALTFEEQRKYHERFGAWTEIYLSQGKTPVRGLEDVFRRLGEWLLDLYRGMLGEAAPEKGAAEKAVGERYKDEFKEDLPQLSSEVKACLDRMYGADERSRVVVPNGVQTAAARFTQSERVNHQKVVAPMKDPRDPDVYRAAVNAQRSAADSLNSGEKVDVSEAVRGQQLNDESITDGQKTFTRTFHVEGSSETIVTLQNRNRDTPASVMQMNNIAGSPEYGRLSFSRTTDTGAPIVSYGEYPAKEFVGVTDYVMDGGKNIPVTYAVVEADSVQTSNFIDGRQNPDYAKDFNQMQAVAGNGRMTGLRESFNRESAANQYVNDLMNDSKQHGVDPEAIRKLKKPALVRIMPKEEVTSGFVDRSNQSQVMDMSGAEQAVRDAEKLAERKMSELEFDANGEPTRAALKNFLADVGDPSALGSMTDANGYPTLPARNRIKAAVFYYAYRDPELTALAFDEMDKQGIKRILNAMMVFAPHAIDIRRASNGLIDIGALMADAVNMIRSGRKMDNDILITEDNAAANPGVRMFMEMFTEHRDSAAAITRVMNAFADNMKTSLGQGSPLLGDPLDTADALQYLRMAQNADISELRGKGEKVDDLPDIDVAAIRETLQAMKTAERPAEQVVQAMSETAAEKVAQDAGVKVEEANNETINVTAPERAQAVFTEDADRVRVENLSAERPDQTYLVINDEGREVPMTAAEVLEHEQKIEESAKKDADGMGKATECIIRNGGIE